MLLPCVVMRLDAFSFCKHPHDFVCPETSLLPMTSQHLPQSQMQENNAFLYLLIPACSMTVNLPNLWPTKS
jgi:hypothetical protein